MSLQFSALLIEQIIWCGVMVLAIQFLAIGAALREEKTFLFLGGALVCLCLMVACDLWILVPAMVRRNFEKPFLDFWHLSYQVMACLFILLMFRFMQYLTGSPGKRTMLLHAPFLMAWTGLSIVDMFHPRDLFIGLRDTEWATSAAFKYGYAPYMLGTFGWMVFQAFSKRRHAGIDARRILDRLCIGFLFLLTTGALDFLQLFAPALLPPFSYTVFGILGFGVFCIITLSDRFLLVYEERRRSLLETARVHGELGADEPLRDIGRSAAYVSDAIRDKVTTLRTKVEFLREGAEGGHGAEIARIESARSKLERLTQGILEYSRSGILGEKVRIHPAALVEDCIRERFPEGEPRIRIRAIGTLLPLPVDRARFKRALLELVGNSFEANAGTVEIRIRQGFGRTVFVVEDDGKGFPDGSLAEITQPFFTTRKAGGGLGLGASIAGGIARGHCGSLRYYARKGATGLMAMLVLPLEPVPAAFASIPTATFVSDDAAKMESFVAACENLGMRPALSSIQTKPAPGSRPAIIVDQGPGQMISEETLLLDLVETGR